ncbi:MAG: chemotaxis protein CheW [Proteobacteria bacterium]|nr:chemotaxis protein CheW [Pseudomonadota bacterium]
MSNEDMRIKRVKGADGNTKFVQASVAPTAENYLQSLEQATDTAETLRIVSFFLNGDEFAFEVGMAVEVIKPRPITEVPRVPGHILGLLSVRGEMVSIMDLKTRLNLGSESSSGLLARILVAGSEEERTGFLVDRMGGVKELRADSIEQTNGLGELFKGVVTVSPESRITLLDMEKLLGSE